MYETGNPEENTKRQIEALKQRLDAIEEAMAKHAESLEKVNETAMGTFVQISRLYDVVSAYLATQDKQAVINILNMHEEGLIYSTAPVLRGFGTGEADDDQA